MSDEGKSVFTDYDYDLAIKLYTQEIEQNDRHNYIAWNNRGRCKVMKGLLEKDEDLIKKGITDFEIAVRIAHEQTGNGYPPAKANIEWAKDIIARQ